MTPHRDAFFRCTRGRAVAGVDVRDGRVTRAAPILRVTRGAEWRTTKARLAAAGWAIEEMEDAEP